LRPGILAELAKRRFSFREAFTFPLQIILKCSVVKQWWQRTITRNPIGTSEVEFEHAYHLNETPATNHHVANT
jgi:hypothetical protein